MPCITTKYSRDTAEATLFVSASKNAGVDIVLLISVYILSADGIVNGITKSQKHHFPQNKKRFFRQTIYCYCPNYHNRYNKNSPGKAHFQQSHTYHLIPNQQQFFSAFQFLQQKVSSYSKVRQITCPQNHHKFC